MLVKQTAAVAVSGATGRGPDRKAESRRFETNTVVRPGYDKAVGHELHGKGFSFVAQQRNLAVSASQRARDFPKSTKNLFGSFANNSQRNWITAIRYKML